MHALLRQAGVKVTVLAQAAWPIGWRPLNGAIAEPAASFSHA